MRYKPWKKAFVTGGSSGIGYEVAKTLVESGVDVVLVARRKENLEEALEKIRRSIRTDGAGRMFVLPLDVCEREEVEKRLPAFFEAARETVLVVNSAGMAYPDYFESLPYDKFQKTMEVNLEGTWNFNQVILPFLGEGSHIVNVASVAGFVGTFGYTAYSASKFAVVGFSEALRNELSARKIGVSVLCPPDTRTPQLEEEKKTKPPETRAISGNAAILEPKDVAKALFKGLRRRRFFIIPGMQGKLIYYIHTYFPRLIYAIIDGEVKKVAKRKGL